MPIEGLSSKFSPQIGLASTVTYSFIKLPLPMSGFIDRERGS